jgi:hypothetical protein
MLLLEHEPVVVPPTVRRRRRRPSEAAIVFAAAASLYVGLAVHLILVRHAIVGDALSRVGNAQYVVSSRDPHLAAIGFVWNPLPSLLDIPFIPLRHLWPAAIATGFIGCVQSALFMAGAVSVLRSTLQDLGLGRFPRLLLTILFALHPMIVFYAYNGMSEAAQLFFAAVTCRALMSWLREGGTRPLVVTGSGLALGYLTRYEFLAPAAAVVLLVTLVSAWRHRGPWRERRSAGLADAALVGLPFAFTFLGWALLSRIIVKEWFPTLQSQYGNSAQVGRNRHFIEEVVGKDLNARIDYVGHQLFALEPLAAVLLVLALLLALLRRDARTLGPLAVAGAVLTFDLAASLNGNSFVWLRFCIAAVPLSVLLAGCVITLAGRRPVLRGLATFLVAAMLAPAFLTSVLAMADRRLGREEAGNLRALARPESATAIERAELRRWDLGKVIADDVEALHPGKGAVVTDAAYAFAILLAARHTSQYVITPDQDFERVLADPVRFGATYLLVPDPTSAGGDGLNVAYPDLYEKGWPGGSLTREWKGIGGTSGWRLYRLPSRSSVQ